MHIPCFMLSRIVVPSWWILSNHLDFSNHNFVTKLPNPGSLKLPTINCFLRRELRLGKLFHWQFVFTKIWYNQKQPCTARPKILSCCDEIMLRDEITGFDGTQQEMPAYQYWSLWSRHCMLRGEQIPTVLSLGYLYFSRTNIVCTQYHIYKLSIVK
jgi:hypothetical protein